MMQQLLHYQQLIVETERENRLSGFFHFRWKSAKEGPS